MIKRLINLAILTLGGKEYQTLLEREIEQCYYQSKREKKEDILNHDARLETRNKYIKLQTKHLTLYDKYHTFGEVTERKWWLQ